ncbi:AMP-binding protein [Streptomyces sp. NBC_01483]|uniref:AMP-binding protein n=1 Tax=Streptomyces sp. NBC_01483 TaxID=2903883 RepID=UPI002E302E99|nr:AMP-binding protein [Streptomyces sp. NBC_01483]
MHLGGQAKQRPDAIAVIESGGRTVTYAELDAWSRHLAAALDLKPEDAVAIRMPSGAAFLEVAWAARRFGLRRTPVDTRLTHLLPSEIDEMTEGEQLTAGPMGDRAAECLELIERHRVTDAQFVPASRSSVRRSGCPARDRGAGRATTSASSTASSTEAEDFLSLPRDPSGKLRKGLLRETYWRNHESRIV